MPLVYEENFRIYQFECDPWDRMTPGAILRRVQEIGTTQCEKLGLNEEHYKKTHTLFLLSRISLEIYKVPMIEDNIRIQTRAYGMQKAVYQRVTSLHNEKGEKLCEADSRWVLVNTQTRHILRREPDDFNSPFLDAQGAEGHEMQMPKPKPAANDLAQKVQLQAAYSLCDRNGHVNNTQYADITCNLLPLDQLQQGPVRKMLLNYHSEIPLGNEFSVAQAPLGDGVYFLAQCEGKKSFECYVAFGS